MILAKATCIFKFSGQETSALIQERLVFQYVDDLPKIRQYQTEKKEIFLRALGYTSKTTTSVSDYWQHFMSL